MAIIETLKHKGRGLVAAVALVSAMSLTAAPSTAYAHGGGIGPGAAVGIGLGAFALGTVLRPPGAYAPDYYPYGYYYRAGRLLSAGTLLPGAAQLLEPILPDLLRLLTRPPGAARREAGGQWPPALFAAQASRPL